MKVLRAALGAMDRVAMFVCIGMLVGLVAAAFVGGLQGAARTVWSVLIPLRHDPVALAVIVGSLLWVAVRWNTLNERPSSAP